MQYTIFTLVATAVTLASAQSSSATSVSQTIAIGGNCVPNGTPCALGANCYAVNSMQQTVCGNFQAVCTSNQQCAFNVCVRGFCSGPIASSSASSTAPIIISASSAQSSSATSVSQAIPIGGNCVPNGTPCALGANCYAVNSMQQTVCGNFQAVCTSDQQCAFNTCARGFCSGPPFPSSSAGNGTVTASSTGGSSTASRNATGTGSMTASRSGSTPEFTNAAAVASMGPEFMAVVLGVAAWAL